MPNPLVINKTKGVALLVIVIVVVSVVIWRMGVFREPSPQAPIQGYLIKEEEGLKFIADCNLLSRERALKAVEEAENTSSKGGEWADRIREGWIVLEINVTMVNNRSIPVTLAADGSCFTPFATINAPLDSMPNISTTEGEAIPAPIGCLEFLQYVKIQSGHYHTTSYYLITTPNYKGSLHLNIEVCTQQNDCHTIKVDVPIAANNCLKGELVLDNIVADNPEISSLEKG